MENDPLAMLAPPDPTAAAAAPAAPQPMAQVDPVYPTSIPSETAPNNPDIERSYHESTWRRILDKVGGILGGDTTIHVTKDKDGNVTMTHDPSTTGEKWARIAATALGGAARGAANSQGPGGAFKGAAAGTEYGLQVNQQRQEDADKQATAEQKRQLNSAQIAALNQEVVKGSWANKNLPQEYMQRQADWALKHANDLQDAGAIPVAMNVSDHDKLVQMGVANPLAVQAHLGTNGEMLYNEPDGKGGVNFYRIPGAVANQRTTEADTWNETYLDPKDPTKTLDRQHVTPAGEKMGDRLKRQMAQQVQNDKVTSQAFNNKQTEAKNSKDRVPKTAAEAIAQAALTTDTDERQRLTAAAMKMQDSEESLRRAGRSTTNVALSPESSNNWGTLLSDPSSGVTLANVPPKQRDQVINAMAAAGQKMAKPLTGAELTRADLAGNAIHNIEEAQAILKRRPDMFGPAGYGKSKFQELLAGGDPDAMAYKTAIDTANLPTLGIHGMKGKYALQDLAKLDSNLYINAKAMENILGEIHRSASEFRYTGGRETKPADTPSGNTSQAARQKEPPAQAFKPAAAQPPNPPFAGAVFGTGAQGTGWYPPSAGGTK